MLDFIYDLYKNDNFILYLTIALGVLLLLFFIVLIFGKKDQKLEETRRLERLNIDKTKNDVKEEKEQKDEIEEKVNVTTFEPEESISNAIEDDEEDIMNSILDSTGDEVGLMDALDATLKDIDEGIESLEKVKSEVESIELDEEEIKEETVVNNVDTTINDDDEEDFELPTLKKEDVHEEKKDEDDKNPFDDISGESYSI